MPAHILVVEPDGRLRESLELLVRSDGHEVMGAANAAEARAALEARCFDLILCDAFLPDTDGDTAFLRWCTRAVPFTTLIATAESSKDEHVQEARRAGAYDYLSKPFLAAPTLLAVRRAEEREEIRRARFLLARELQHVVEECPIVAASPAMIELLERTDHVAALHAPALLLGERGSGKDALARVIHAQSTRRGAPFVRIDCRNTPPDRLERSLFESPPSMSHGRILPARGLLREASAGTVYIAGIEAAPPRVHERLLAVLGGPPSAVQGRRDSPASTARLLASSEVDLEASASIGEFSRDLLARFAAARLSVPPLRARRHDIPLLVDHFFERACQQHAKRLRDVSDEALECLTAYPWPGNIPELRGVIERAVLLAGRERLTRSDLPEELRNASAHDVATRAPDLGMRRARKHLEADLIRRALRETAGNRTHAARLLQISHRALLYKIKEHRIRD
ncbi:MAG: sigma 54-interacting transcriptional regulator [Myxococcales bacterium]|nr:sigma 54-interacting transcriptional regulator [Myxococcales bacterium]MDH5305810.1 sigma 54-interacting transcriptional regulator [Myxococcales bacterium]MDH5566809.1 sigma 54-interacting transcriptional regulator [Myxococcales bacterium]